MTLKELQRAKLILSAKLDDLNKIPNPTTEQRSVKAELVEAINEIREEILSMPAHAPRTLANIGTQLAHSAGPFTSLTDQLMAVVRAATPGQQIDPRLYQVTNAAGLNETVPSEGGFLVQTDFSNVLLGSAIETGILAQRCMRERWGIAGRGSLFLETGIIRGEGPK